MSTTLYNVFATETTLSCFDPDCHFIGTFDSRERAIEAALSSIMRWSDGNVQLDESEVRVELEGKNFYESRELGSIHEIIETIMNVIHNQ